ncbi:hypothetical protein [Sphingosinicella sp.]|uniref:hypothetical protein n=1 Tax=Sphingosinicella sp. TaxID=1917971 RepID=UPI004037A001
MRRYFGLLSALVSAWAAATAASAQTAELTVTAVRTLPVPELARALLGERLGSRVIEAVRHDYEASQSVPRSVDFFTQPFAPWPRLNRICQTDVITIEYNWADLDEAQPSTPVTIFHIEATSRYLAIPEPPGDPSDPEYQRAHEAACAALTSARGAFRAPDAGDAQWLAAMEAEWSRTSSSSRFDFACDVSANVSCESTPQALSRLRLNQAAIVQRMGCPEMRRRGQINFCYRLIFPYADAVIDEPEWDMTLVGEMQDGSAPVEIRSLRLLHMARPIVLH